MDVKEMEYTKCRKKKRLRKDPGRKGAKIAHQSILRLC
jgi:hypothetical protein